jgi:hypothetical protein
MSVLALMQVLCAQVVIAATACPTYTPKGGSIDPVKFQSWVAGTTGPTLCVAPGVYTVEPAPKTTQHLLFDSHLTNVVLDLTDVELVMQSRSMTAVKVTNWDNSTLRGLTVSYATHPTNQAAVSAIAADGEYLDVQVPAGYPLSDWDALRTFSCNVYLPGTRWLRVGAGDMYAKSIEALGSGNDGKFRMHFGRDVGPNSQAIEVGDTLGCRNAAFAFTFFVDGCRASTFSDVTLLGGPGFGFFHGPALDSCVCVY